MLSGVLMKFVCFCITVLIGTWAGDLKAHASDLEAEQCISSWRRPMQNGYIDWGLRNSCDYPIAFDFDYCNTDADMQADCTVKTGTVSRQSEFSDSNYHQPANVRN